MTSVIIGTAQWGMDYGATNSVGRLPHLAIEELVARARGLGITILDTAPAYGDAETRVGALRERFEVQTKVSGKAASEAGIRASLRSSADRLGRPPERVLVHDWPVLDADERALVAAVLEQERADGRVGVVGVSGYDEIDLATALADFSILDVAQLPVSVLDQRLAGSDAVADLREAGGVMQVRSIYLQGVALGDTASVPQAGHPDVIRLQDEARRLHIAPLALCVGYIRSCTWVDEVVVGLTSVEELEDFVQVVAAPPEVDWTTLASRDVDLLDPRRWSANRGQGG